MSAAEKLLLAHLSSIRCQTNTSRFQAMENIYHYVLSTDDDVVYVVFGDNSDAFDVNSFRLHQDVVLSSSGAQAQHLPSARLTSVKN
jgi:hypothetical protein